MERIILTKEKQKEYKDKYMKDFKFFGDFKVFSKGDIVYHISSYNYQTEIETIDKVYSVEDIYFVQGFNGSNGCYIYCYDLKEVGTNKHIQSQTPFGIYKKEYLDLILGLSKPKPKQLSIFDL